LNYYTNAKIPKQVELMLPWCCEKTELHSYCDKCSNKATMTDTYNMTPEEQIKDPVGGSEKYRAICRDCYIIKYKKS
jgi:thymidine kinase